MVTNDTLQINILNIEMKHREYFYIGDKTATGYDYKTIPIESEDVFDSPLLILAFPMKEMGNVGEILSQFGYQSNQDYFFEQCREVISVAEKHQTEKGEGKISFQAYFHNFPNSVAEVNDRAIVVVVLHPKTSDSNGPKDYWLTCYIHANVFDFKDLDGKTHEGFYYNMLRISGRTEAGEKVYRRKKIFTLVFSVLHSLVDVYGLHFAYASMGKENQAIVDALVTNSKKYQKHFERFSIKNNTIISRFFRRKSAAAKLVDITNDEARLREMYHLLNQQTANYVFQLYHNVEEFLKMINSLKSYSKTSKVLMTLDTNGNIAAACVAMNWGDYFQFVLENPKGLFKLVSSMKLTDHLLYPFCLCGSPEEVNTLLRGVAYNYSKQHKNHLIVMNSYAGDPYAKVKDSLIFDEYMFFIITDKLDHFNRLKEQSKDSAGNVRFFIDNPIL